MFKNKIMEKKGQQTLSIISQNMPAVLTDKQILRQEALTDITRHFVIIKDQSKRKTPKF